MIIEIFEKEALAFKCPYFLLLSTMNPKATSFLLSLFNILNREGIGLYHEQRPPGGGEPYFLVGLSHQGRRRTRHVVKLGMNKRASS